MESSSASTTTSNSTCDKKISNLDEYVEDLLKLHDRSTENVHNLSMYFRQLHGETIVCKQELDEGNIAETPEPTGSYDRLQNVLHRLDYSVTQLEEISKQIIDKA